MADHIIEELDFEGPIRSRPTDLASIIANWKPSEPPPPIEPEPVLPMIWPTTRRIDFRDLYVQGHAKQYEKTVQEHSSVQQHCASNESKLTTKEPGANLMSIEHALFHEVDKRPEVHGHSFHKLMPSLVTDAPTKTLGF